DPGGDENGIPHCRAMRRHHRRLPLQARHDDQRRRSIGVHPMKPERNMIGDTSAALPARSANNLAVQIYTQLKADIFDFRLLPGDKFSEGDIAQRMQVSRTPVRQALFWLQREGYVDVHFRSGWQVRSFNFKYFEDLYEIRIMMETSAVSRIVAHGLTHHLEPLREIWCVPAGEQLDEL